ncbi:PP2C family protein-serine/threonine phosphatase [Streptomyces sp. NPDC088246]|uniref:PP2C family protein-serine/threonine phosphatase n=1 Tax=Streptomyces sp. NPDC088246 TaxID=3365842 RepID=UPI0037F5505A
MTHRGALRDANEDAFVIGVLTATGVDTPDPLVVNLVVQESVVVAVADGLGGHNAGEVASALAVRRLAERGPRTTDASQVLQLLRDVNAELYELARTHPAHTGAGTTAVGLLVTPHEITWFNVGDSRLYREDGGYLGQVSVDDSASAAWDDCGEPAAATSIVLQSLGGADRFEPVHPHSGTDVRLPGTRWLLCSDGLSDLVDAAEMESLLADNADDDVRAVKALWAAAMNAGGRDNITVVLVRC